MARASTKRHPKQAPQGTADRDEIARFTAMADAWWDPSGKFRPLHMINPVRIGFIRDHVSAHFGRDPLGESPLKGLTLLDIGCGGGLLCEPMARLGAAVTGIDAGEETIRIAKQHTRENGLDIDYRNILPEELADGGAQYDIVLNMEVVEHVADLNAFLEACSKLVRPGGVMAASTLNRTFKALALAKVGAEYILRWLPAGTHDWRKFVKPSEFARGLRAGGLETAALKGLEYSPFSDEWSLSDNLDVNYLLFAKKGSGD